MIAEIIRFWDRKITPGFQVNPTDLVIDIGSGDKPFWRADVFLDKLSLDNRQRISGLDTVHDLGFFVDSDITKTPFKKGAFNYSFCSHLLEHVEDPAAVIDEITRISKSGYLEIPNGILETIKPFHSHLWFVYYTDHQLTFVRKSQAQHDLLTKNGLLNQSMIGYAKVPFIQIEWKHRIAYQIINLPQGTKPFRVQPNYQTAPNHTNYYLWLVKILRLIFYKPKTINQAKLFSH